MPSPLTWDNLDDLEWDRADLTWDGDGETSNQPSHPMANDNRISTSITAEQKAAIEAAVAALVEAFDGILINLTLEERQSLPRISDKTLAFDQKCAEYMSQRADLIPSYLDMAEMAVDRKLIADLRPCLQQIAPLCEALDDTLMLANSDNYVGDLAFYQNVRQAARRGVPGTDTIYSDLKERFPGRPPKDKPGSGSEGGTGTGSTPSNG